MSPPGTHQVRNQVIECISGENGDAPGSCQLLGDAAEDDRDVSVPVGVGPAFQGGGRAQVENLRQFYHSFLEQQKIHHCFISKKYFDHHESQRVAWPD